MIAAIRRHKWQMAIISALSLAFAGYLAYQASLRVPNFDTSLAAGLLEEPVRTVPLVNEYQAAHNLHKGLPIKQSEQRMGQQFDRNEIKQIINDAEHRQLIETSVLAAKAIAAWAVGTTILVAIFWCVGAITRKIRRLIVA